MQLFKIIRICLTERISISHLQRSLNVKPFLKRERFPQISHFNHKHKSASEKLGEHQKELMARGLPRKKPIQGVKNIILVVSGKGGVGKSTTAVNTAVALSEMKNIAVGLLDADVFGPSIPLMMDVNESPALTNENKMIPLENYGVQCMSMGFLVTETSAVIWRGLMVMSALERLMRQVAWKNVDFLIVDTPPGTGDTLLSLMQNLPITGVIMVSTPQKAAVQVSRRGASMLQKLSVPIIGLVENMSSIECPSCNHNISLFGEYTKELASELNIPLLAQIPLDSSISTASDGGIPVVLSEPKSKQAEEYRTVAKNIIKFVNRDVKED